MAGSAFVRRRPTVAAADGAGVKPGSNSCMPASVPATVVAIGPTVSRLGASGHTPSSGMRPWVVFNPTVPQHADGILIEPPVSEPSATSAWSVATATADPLEEPPGMRSASSGLTGVPNQGFVPIGSIASSCMFALPTRRAPAAREPARHEASRNAGSARSATARQPAVVTTPSTSMMSLTATRIPLPLASSFVMNVDMVVTRRPRPTARCPRTRGRTRCVRRPAATSAACTSTRSSPWPSRCRSSAPWRRRRCRWRRTR
jgi:hypothetical protein